MYIYLNILQQCELEWNESTRRNAWLSLLDTSPWWEADSEECDVVWRSRYFVF